MKSLKRGFFICPKCYDIKRSGALTGKTEVKINEKKNDGLAGL